MKKSVHERAIGRRLGEFFGVFFMPLTGLVDRPTSIVVPQGSGRYVELTADNVGGLKESEVFLDRIYFDRELGYSFVGPLNIVLGDRVSGDEKVTRVSANFSENLSVITYFLDTACVLEIRVEDDEIWVTVEPMSSQCDS